MIAGQVGTRLSGPLSMIPKIAAKRVSLTPKRSSPHAIPSIGLLVSHSRTGLMYPFGFGLAMINGTPRTPSTCGGKRYGGISGTHRFSPMLGLGYRPSDFGPLLAFSGNRLFV